MISAHYDFYRKSLYGPRVSNIVRNAAAENGAAGTPGSGVQKKESAVGISIVSNVSSLNGQRQLNKTAKH